MSKAITRLERLKKMADKYTAQADAYAEQGRDLMERKMRLAASRSWDAYHKAGGSRP